MNNQSRLALDEPAPIKKGSSDPGYGDALAPKGTEQWAKHWRLKFQAMLSELDFDLSHTLVVEYFKDGYQHRVWILLNKKDGSKFTTWAEFVSYKQPWGLGMPDPDSLRKCLEIIAGKRSIDLETVAPDGRANNVGEGRKPTYETNEVLDSGHDVPNLKNNKSQAEEKQAKRLRAITRAPEAIQQLYRDGLIGQVVAAKLGPAEPEPWESARITKIASEVANTPVPAAKRERDKVKREVNAKVLEMLDAPRQTPEVRAAAAIAKSKNMSVAAERILAKVPKDRLVDLITAIIDRLGPDDQQKLHQWVKRALEGP